MDGRSTLLIAALNGRAVAVRRGRHARPEIHTFIYEAGLKDEIFALTLYYTTSENIEEPNLANR
ncbi:histone acetyltransferase KAT2A like protein, partial [Danaus plexippus plexippus]